MWGMPRRVGKGGVRQASPTPYTHPCIPDPLPTLLLPPPAPPPLPLRLRRWPYQPTYIQPTPPPATHLAAAVHSPWDGGCDGREHAEEEAGRPQVDAQGHEAVQLS